MKAVYKDCIERGYVLVGDKLHPPDHPAAIAYHAARSKRKKRAKNLKKTGWIDDERNIRNKELQKDTFIMLMEKEGIDCWPEFFFSTERQYRIDYAIPTMANSPQLKIAIEVNGGVWLKGNSGHSSGKGILRDYEKANMLQSLGWKLITITPDQMLTSETIELIKSLINQKL